MTDLGGAPLVSIIMPTFNPGPSIKRAIGSVIEQTYGSWELIVVDDASTEALDDVLRSYGSADNRIRSIRLASNSGPAAARNAGLALSTGDWIAVLDDDDMWLPTRLEALLAETSRGPRDMVFDNIIGFDDHSNELTGPLFEQMPDHLKLLDVLLPQYRGIYNLGFIKPLIKKEFLAEHGIAYDESLRGAEDLLLLLELLAKRAINSGINDALYVYTTQIGRKSGLRSTKTRSLPRGKSIGEAMFRFCRTNEALLSSEERSAIEHSASSFIESVPLSEFQHAKFTRQWGDMTRIFFRHPSVRRYVHTKIGQRIRKVLSS
jgi:succinoglycan biosynthesis protein ExoO